MGTMKPKIVTLEFDGSKEEDRERFPLVHQAILFGYDAGTGGIDRMRRLTSLLGKFAAISELAVTDDGTPVRYHTQDEQRNLLPGGGRMELDLGEFEMLTRAAERTPWRAGKVPEAVAMIDWLAERKDHRNGGPPPPDDDTEKED